MTQERLQSERNTAFGVGFQGLTAVQRKVKNLRLQKPSTDAPNDEATSEKTRLGLTELHSPTHAPSVDFIFVHGLRGGSVKTWRKHKDASYFWPKAWIPLDTDLAAVRTSSFGYQSDWISTKESILNVHEFGRKLLGDMRTAPFLRRSGDTHIVFIGHSMGGLVIKKAFLLAQRECPELAARIKAIFFLATPHRGSDSADLLHGLLDFTGNQKPFVDDLLRHSPSLEQINDDFRHVAHNLSLWTFFEEQKTDTPLKSGFIVERDSAVLGFKDEKIMSLNANHREICKFEGPEDENYVTLRNALVTVVDQLLQHHGDGDGGPRFNQLDDIKSFLNITDRSESDLEELQAIRTTGTCEWLEHRSNLQAWLRDGNDFVVLRDPQLSENLYMAPKPVRSPSLCGIYWLTAKPGAGKSVCSAHFVKRLRDQGYNCAYFFFQAGVESKHKLSSMLRSIAFQMAKIHQSIRTLMREMGSSGINFDKDSDDAVWRHVFANGILKAKLDRPQVWILDGLDQCLMGEKLLLLIAKMDCFFTLRIFIASRPQVELARGFNRLSPRVTVVADSIKHEDTQTDMLRYLSSDEARLDIEDSKERLHLEQKLLARSNDCFLWVRLVRYELEGVYLDDSIENVLDEIPTEMSELYERLLLTISNNVREKKLTQALFTWSVCAWRPLALAELQVALKLDSNFQIRDLPHLRRSIEGLCGNLLYVDRNDDVRLFHSTLRDFLFDSSLASDYAVPRQAGHERLAKVCFSYMKENMRPRRSRSFGRSLETQGQDRAVFTGYAATSFSEHIAAASSTSDSLIVSISNFLDASVLSWIEHIASEEPSLYFLTRTAKNFKQYLERRAKHVSPLGKEFKLIHDWATDLVRVVAKFGRNLKQQPSSISLLIPCIAPRASQLYTLSLKLPQWLQLLGLANAAWDDCVSSIEYRQTYATALASGLSIFAIGMKSGAVMLYDHATCQEKINVAHQLPEKTRQKQSPTVRLLSFDALDHKFASAGLQSICVWSVNGELLHMFEIQEPLVTLQFSTDQKSIFGVTRSSKISRFFIVDEDENGLTPPLYLDRRRSSGYISPQSLKLPKQAPLAAAISPDQSVLALLYRGQPVFLYNLEHEHLLGTCGRDSGSSGPNISVLTALFNPNPNSGLLAISHQDGDLALYDSWTQRELVTVYGDAYTLAATPDGQTLGTGNTGGTVRLWDFETLTLLYTIKSGLEEVRSLAFTGDGLRLVDRRDTRVKIWEPSALIRKPVDEDGSQSDALPLPAPEVGVNDETITTTAMCADDRGHYIFTGHSNGFVIAFDIRVDDTPNTTIHNFPHDTFVETMAFANDILAVVDSAQTVHVWKMPRLISKSEGHELLFRKSFAEPVEQLLLQENGLHLLVATAGSDEIIHLARSNGSTLVPHLSSGLVQSRRWATMNDHILVIDSGESIRLYDWINAQEVQAFPLRQPRRAAHSRSAIVIQSFSTTQTGSYLAAVLYQTRAETQLVSWINPYGPLTSSLTPSDSTPSLPAIDLPSQNVHTFLGIFREQIVFLDHDLWICSLKLDEIRTNTSSDIIKHIFIPPDFVGGPTVAKPFVTQHGHLVFSKEDKLAVIKSAFDWSFTT